MLLRTKRVGMRPAEAPVYVASDGLTDANNNPGKFRCQCLASTARMQFLP